MKYKNLYKHDAFSKKKKKKKIIIFFFIPIYKNIIKKIFLKKKLL